MQVHATHYVFIALLLLLALAGMESRGTTSALRYGIGVQMADLIPERPRLLEYVLSNGRGGFCFATGEDSM